MDAAAFEAELRRDGYTDIETREAVADHFAPEHEHPCDIRALVIAGQVTLDIGGSVRTYRSGDTIVLDAGCRHSEQNGPDGYSYVVGRRQHRRASGQT